ncbi:unnamed protein product, partial [marine sediment metagenome]
PSTWAEDIIWRNSNDNSQHWSTTFAQQNALNDLIVQSGDAASASAIS